MKISEIPYERISIEEYRDIVEQLLNAFEQCTSAKQQKQIYLDFIEQSAHYSTMRSLLSIRHSQNTVDAFYIKEREYYLGVSGEFKKLSQGIKEKL